MIQTSNDYLSELIIISLQWVLKKPVKEVQVGKDQEKAQYLWYHCLLILRHCQSDSFLVS